MKKLLMLTGAAADTLFVSLLAKADTVQWYKSRRPSICGAGPGQFLSGCRQYSCAGTYGSPGLRAGLDLGAMWPGTASVDGRSGGQVETTYQDKPSYVVDAGPTLKVPVVTYDTNTYWDSNYRSAPFYTQRERYVQWEQH